MTAGTIEDIYKLSPVQHGILVHCLSHPTAGLYIEQFSWTFDVIDLAAFTRAWALVQAQHPILRTAFFWEDADEPLQVVQRRVSLPLTQLDWRAQSPAEQDQQLAALLAADRRQGFDLTVPPLMRLTVIRRADTHYQCIWSYHHLLLDGWSVGLLMQDAFGAYESLCQGQPVQLPSRRPYRDYIAWLRKQNLAQAEVIWRQQLADVTAPTPLGVDRRPSSGAMQAAEPYAERQRVLSASLTQDLQALVRHHHLTLTTLLEGAWALVLRCYSGSSAVVFGLTVGGRSLDLPGVEAMVGLFINTLPVRVLVPPAQPLLAWLAALQSQQAALGQYEYSPLVEVQRWSGVPYGTPLFESILVVENYWLPTKGRAHQVGQRTNYPLTVVAEPGLQLRLRIGFEVARFADETVERMLGHLETVLARMLAQPEGPVGAVSLLTAAEQAAIVRHWRGREKGALPAQGMHELVAAQVERRPDAVAVVFDRPKTNDQRPTRRQGDKETRSQESGVRSQEAALLPPPAGGRAEGGRLPPPAGGGTEGGRRRASAAPIPNPQFPIPNPRPSALSPQSSVLSPEHLTYAELNAQANRLAHHLRRLGVVPEERVGVCLERGAGLVVALLGVLKAGAAYVPLEPSYPPERLKMMLRDSGARVVVSEQRLLGLAGVQEISLDWEGPALTHEAADPVSRTSAEHVAYLIYTSGSTGTPKGVLVTHANLVRLFTATQEWSHFDDRDVWTLFHSAAFDFSVWEVWGALCYGGRLVVVSHWVSRSPEAFYELLCAERVTILNQTPSAFRQLIRAEEQIGIMADLALRLVIFGGEALEFAILTPWFERHGDQMPQLVNMYGITETTVHVTYRPIRADDVAGESRSVIGQPIRDVQVYLLDDQLRPVPIGVPGELYVGGAGVARGYLNRPDLTAERFLPNPFAGGMGDGGWGMEDASPSPIPHPPSPGTRLYKTGDRARYLASGEFEYLGRIDQQVKVRGFRIEPGEIETVLSQHPSVREAVVLAREEGAGDVRLVAYVVPKIEDRRLKIEDSNLGSSERLSSIFYPLSSELRTFLQQHLPDYMVPSAFVTLDALPLTPNGKLDRRVLPAPNRASLARADFAAPRAPQEEMLASIFAAVLGVRQVGIHDHFFDLGGHSLLATQVISRVRRTFEIELPLRSLFMFPTVAALAEQISALQRDAHGVLSPPLRPIGRGGTSSAGSGQTLPLSFAQQRLWFLAQLEPNSSAYHIPVAVHMRGMLNVSALRWGLDQIVRRHEALRTTFAAVDGQPVQVIGRAQALRLPLIDLRGLPQAEREAAARRLTLVEVGYPFDLAHGSPLRAALLRLDDDDHTMVLTMHHIVSDGWSMGILVRELAALYAAFGSESHSVLPALPIQYADYAVWQREWLQGSGVRDQGAAAPLPPPARGGTNLPPPARGGTNLPPPARGGTNLPPPARGGTNLPPPARGGTNLPPPARGGTEGGRSQESDIGRSQTQNSKLKTQNSPFQVQLTYWRQQLANLPPLELPTDRPRSLVSSFQAAYQGFRLSRALCDEILAISQRESSTLFMTLLSAFQVLLARYSDQDDIPVGTPIANRTHDETELLIGFFVNTLVLRTSLAGNPTFYDALGRVREVCLGAYAHQDLPFEHVVEALQPERDLSRHPLFQVMFMLQNAPLAPLALPGLTLQPLAIPNTTSKFDLSLSLVEDAGELVGTFEYRADLFDTCTITRLAQHFQVLLEAITAQPDRRLSELPLLTDAEQQRVLIEWNTTTVVPAHDQCIHQLFEAQAARVPDAVALVFDRGQGSGVRGQGSEDKETRRHGDTETEDRRSKIEDRGSTIFHPPSSILHPPSSILHPQSLTYRELNVRANRLAHHLRTLGVGPEVPVGVLVERSLDMVVGLLGILKAGGVYLPLDPADPPERLATLLADARPPVLLTTTDHRPPTNDQRPKIEDGRSKIEDRRSPAFHPRSSILDPRSPIPHPPSPIPHPMVVCIDSDWETIARACSENPLNQTTSDNLAYLIYTSGSTGTPKGVLGYHRGSVNRFLWMWTTFPFEVGEVCCQKTALSFVDSIWELFGPLLQGIRVVLIPDEVLKDPGRLVPTLATQGVTRIVLVPSLLLALLDTFADLRRRLPKLKHWTTSGEPLPVELCRRFREQMPRSVLLNLYGSSEVSADATWFDTYKYDGDTSVPIGRPIANIQIYLLDRHGQPMPIGVPGELHVGGAGLARGYLGRPDLTAERFVPNPFAGGMGDGGWGMEDASPSPIPARPLRYACPPSPGTRLYRTGDRARYRPDGNIEFLGRRDQQVKIRGFRIELGEVAAILRQHPAVQECVVLAHEDVPGDTRLVAYLVTSDKSQVTSEDGDRLVTRYSLLVTQVRAFLQAKLPDYMVPATFVVLDALPLLPSGKVDRSALPAPDTSQPVAREGFAAPRTPTEELLSGTWAAVLGVPLVGVHDNFFRLGGHSLLAMRVISRIRKTFDVELPVRSLFEAPTLADLARLLDGMLRDAPERKPPLRAIGRDGPLPLSFAQQRLWFLDQLEPNSAAYHLPIAVRLCGRLDILILKQGLDAIMRRHEALRTTFVAVDGQPAQVIHPDQRLALPLLDLGALPKSACEAAAYRLTTDEIHRPFDLARGPLIRSALLRLAREEHILLLTTHHIISDGWSQGVLLRELAILYEAFTNQTPSPLPELPLQYADYAVWQRQWLQGSGVGGQGTGDRGHGDTKIEDRGSKIEDRGSTIFHPPSSILHPPSPNTQHPTPLQAQLAYWKRQLAGLIPLELPSDRPRPALQTFRGTQYPVAIRCSLAQSLRELSQREGVTLFMTLLTAFQILLARYSGQEDVGVGTPIAGRNHAEVEDAIGFFANTLVMRTDLSGVPTIRELLGRVREVALGAYSHQDVPFEQLVEALQPARDLSYNPLFQVLFALQNMAVPSFSLHGLTLRRLEFDRHVARFDLCLDLWEGPESMSGWFEYSTDLFDATTIIRMAGHFQVVLEAIVADLEQRVTMLPILTEPERQQLLVAWNATGITVSLDRCLHDLFGAQAEQTPDVVALVYEGARLTYGGLNRQANRLAHYLRSLGIGPDVRVGICLERSLELLVAILGVLKAGGAYVPLDPAYPPERLAFMLEDSQAAVLITTTDDRPTTNHQPPTTNDQRPPTTDPHPPSPIPHPPSPNPQSPIAVDLRADWPTIAAAPSSPPTDHVYPDNLAYAIYTSGSTGWPKGVQVSHRSVMNLMSVTRPLLQFGASDIWTIVHSYAFDFSVWELWGPLLYGGCLVIMPLWMTQTPAALRQLLVRERVTVLNQTPSALRLLLEVFDAGRELTGDLSLRLIACGGEAFPPELVQPALAWRVPVWNFYGPTEATVWATTRLLKPGDRLPEAVSIGRPLGNIEIYVLDKHLQPVPVGVPGELCIGGVGLARGYINRPDLTAGRFIPNPFARGMGDGGWGMGSESSIAHPSPPPALRLSPIPRMYKTGDLARYRPDGNIEYLGRLDHQIKIRGFRIELGEIEAVLATHPAIREAVVLAREDVSGTRRLVAYVVQGSGVRGQGGTAFLPPPAGGGTEGGRSQESDVGESQTQNSKLKTQNFELRTFLAEKLPDYMVPTAFVFLAELPLTPNHKVNRYALPAPEDIALVTDDADRVSWTPVEELVVGIWTHVLGLKQVGLHDNFFALGGHSLLATQVVARIRDTFGVELPVRSLFEAPTVAALVAHLAVARPAALPPLRPAARDHALPLSFAQQRLWFLDQLAPASPAYNLPAALRLRGPLAVAALARSLNALVKRHEILRTTFALFDGQPVQQIALRLVLPLALIDLQALPAATRTAQVQQLANVEAWRPFDLRHGPLLRATLLRLQPQEHVLLLTMHHIVADDWSIRVLIREITTLYADYQYCRPAALPALPLQYADYAVWQRQWFAGAARATSLAYWQQQLAGLPVLALPTARPRPAAATVAGARQPIMLPAELSAALLALSRQEGVTLFMVLLGLFQVLLAHWSGQTDIVVGTDVANRPQVELEPLIGFFVNQLVLRIDLAGDPTFREVLARVRGVCLGAYAHQQVPFDQLVAELQPERRLDRTPLFQVKLVLHNAPTATLTTADLAVESVAIPIRAVPFDLVLSLYEMADGIRGEVDYRVDLFEGTTIRWLLRRMEDLARVVVQMPEVRLSALEQALAQVRAEQRRVQEQDFVVARRRKLATVRRKAV